MTPVISAAIGELLLGLRYLRNEWNAPRLSVKVSYCLVYRTSEIPVPTDALPARVNYCLIYDVFETGAIAAGTLIAGELLPGLRYIRNSTSGGRWRSRVNYCLVYGTSETCASQRPFDSQVNYYLDYGASETSSLALAARRR